MKSFYKKTITLIYLLFFLFSFFIPFNKSFAQDATNRLIITTDSPNTSTLKTIKQDENTRITAKLYTAVGGEIVSFSTTTILSSFTPQKTCTIPKRPETTLSSYRIESCFVNFKTGTAGSPTITASVDTDGKTYSSNLKLIVLRCDLPNTIINGACTPPEITKPEPKINTDTIYTPLAPLPGLGESFDTLPSETNKCPFGNYLNIIIKLILGIAAVLAMVMITMGGIQYMTSDLVSSKEAGKETVTNAILGLLIGLGAWLILNTINPALLNACLDKLPQATVTITPDQELTIKNRSGGGVCETITDSSKAGYPSTIEKSGFSRDTSANEPFKKLSAQASAISRLESGGASNKLSSMDICSDNKSFSFGLFQVNAIAHRNEISACSGAFTIPAGDKTSQGSPVEYVTNKNGVKYVSKWSCKTVEPAYTNCKNYLLNPTNNIKFAEGNTLYGKNKWVQWSTYDSCKSKF